MNSKDFISLYKLILKCNTSVKDIVIMWNDFAIAAFHQEQVQLLMPEYIKFCKINCE